MRPITSNHEPIVAHAHATIPINKIIIVARSNNEVGLASTATHAITHDKIVVNMGYKVAGSSS